MQASDPQFLLMALILPSMFGLTLVGEGVYKLTHDRIVGWVNIVMGAGFMGVVVVAYFLLSDMF